MKTKKSGIPAERINCMRLEAQAPAINLPGVNVTPTLLINLGSIAVHAEEMLSPKGHDFDVHALRTNLENAEVKEFIAAMQKLAFVPVKR